MKKIIILSLVLFCCFLYACSGEVPLEERPMYGNAPLPAKVQEINERFIKEIEQSGTRKKGAEEALYLAQEFYSKGDLKMAMKRFNQAWLLDPNNPEIYFGFARIADKRNKPKEAIDMYSKTITLDPNYSLAYSNRGLCYIRIKNIEQAISDFTKAIELNPDDAQNYNDRAVCYAIKNEYDKSSKDVQKAQALGYKVDPKFILKLEKHLKK